MTLLVHEDKLPESFGCILHSVTGSYLKVSVLLFGALFKSESLISLILKYFNSADL